MEVPSHGEMVKRKFCTERDAFSNMLFIEIIINRNTYTPVVGSVTVV